MNVISINKHLIVWGKLVSELLETQRCFYVFPEINFIWARDNILDSITHLGLTPNIIFKNMVYMNRKSKVGRFALTYSNKLSNIINNMDKKELNIFLSNPITPEYDNNELLDINELSLVTKQINKEMITMNNLIDIVSRLDVIPRTILGTEIHEKCNKDVCVYSNSDSVFISSSIDSLVWITDYPTAMCFSLPELIIRISTDDINPYTNKKFTPVIVDKIKLQYNLEFKLVRKYFE